MGDDTLYLKFWGQTGPVRGKTPIFHRYSPSAVTPGKNVLLSLRKSTTRFQMSLKACAHGKEVARATCLQLEGCGSCLLKRGGHTER